MRGRDEGGREGTGGGRERGRGERKESKGGGNGVRKRGQKERPKNKQDIPNYVLVPAFMTHEITKAFKMGIFIFIPFLLIDLIISSILMAMGMIMLPPVMIALPFKIILFVLVDGWNLIITNLINGFK